MGSVFSQGKINKCFEETSEIGVKLPLSVLIDGVFGMGALNDILLEA